MKFHIVSVGETLNKIAFLYNLDEEELKKENKHVRLWDRLVPGTKLKIPTISETTDHEISTMEPFIEDYYPKLKIDNLSNLDNYSKNVDSQKISEPQIENQQYQEQIMQNQNYNNQNESITAEDNLQITSGKQEIKTFTSDKAIEQQDQIIPELIKQETAHEYRPPYYVYPNYVYYQYPRYVYPSYYYPVYYYPIKTN